MSSEPDLAERLDIAIKLTRERWVPGTETRYPGTKLDYLTLTDAVALADMLSNAKTVLGEIALRDCEYTREGLHDPDDSCDKTQRPWERVCDACRARRILGW